eukprot:758602-Hanusia_phi.AAC.2
MKPVDEDEYFPARHNSQDAKSGEDDFPASQGRQADSDVALSCCEYLPKGQKLQAEVPACENVPAGQVSQ